IASVIWASVAGRATSKALSRDRTALTAAATAALVSSGSRLIVPATDVDVHADHAVGQRVAHSLRNGRGQGVGESVNLALNALDVLLVLLDIGEQGVIPHGLHPGQLARFPAAVDQQRADGQALRVVLVALLLAVRELDLPLEQLVDDFLGAHFVVTLSCAGR